MINMAQDYDVVKILDLKADNNTHVKLELKLKPTTDLPYPKVVIKVDKQRLLMDFIEYYGENGKLINEAGLKALEKKIFGEVVMGSDAFFPFPDNVEAAHDAGVRYIVQPGGSKKDDLSIESADKFGIAMVFTGMRHFRH